ncbi:protein FAM200C-like [Palaemon carinicauda]|uniref:protein FAM200C-like n=1 Tax=Palaemon carinicauda TaxID=392227 RepID=UPI0035B57A0E
MSSEGRMLEKRRLYQDGYLYDGFTSLVKEGAHIPQCVVCLKTFSNSSMKPFQLKQHLVAKAKKRHTIGESLLKPCIVDSVRLVLGEESSQKMKQISLSNNTIKNRIAEMSENIKENVVSKMTTKAVDVLVVIANFLEESGLSWNKLEGVCTDGGPNMLGSRSGFIALVKQKQPSLKGTHCMIHREALASKTVPKNLHDALTVIINIVNYVKGSALNTRLFRELCRDMDANNTDLLFHTQVRWLSKGNMLTRVFELRDEIKLFLTYSIKVDKLSAFNKEVFVAQMAYLADIFETE